MHPILFRIPLPHAPLKLWWALCAVAAIALVYALVAGSRREKNDAITATVVAVAAGGAAWVYRAASYEAPNVPIYAYGVMLGTSLVVGWYLTLPLAEKDGLPKETMANCYVVTALAALAGSRVLYVVTNLDEFKSVWDLFALRNGGLVAYGGFIGGLLGSWAFLAPKQIRLLAWADDAVPEPGLGADDHAHRLLPLRLRLRKAPPGRRAPVAQDARDVPALGFGDARERRRQPGVRAAPRRLPRHARSRRSLIRMNSSFPVHPTQLYESLVGLVLLMLLLWQRKYTRFRGQVFFLFVFAYGFLRFVLELWRDDVERGSYGPTLDAHVYVPLCLLLLALGFVFGISLGIVNKRARAVARVLALLPPIVAYIALRPASFAQTEPYQLSTSQLIGLGSGLVVSFFYARYWEDARKNPRLAMSLGDVAAIRRLRGEADQPERREHDDDEVEPETT